MDENRTSLERAFDLAKSGRVASVAEIKKRLNQEGYVGEQISGPLLTKQLLALIVEARR